MTDVMTAVVPASPVASPYKGLANFTEEDAAFFFGRERERDVIIANLRARRITVLYGPSGVGKTSLLRAGVVPDLLSAARESMQELGTPEFIPLVFSAWRDDPLRGLIEAIEVSAQRFVNVPLHVPRSGGLAEAVEVAADAADACLLVILDQFEEYFLYHADESGRGTFADELPSVIAQSGLQADFLISIREDAVAKLDRFKSRIPSLFDTFLRVEHLDAAAARAAIERPVDEYNAQIEPDRRMSVDSSLIDAVLAQVRTGQVVFEQAGHGAVQHRGSGSSVGDRIETPYLQLVMARLWDEETQRGSRSLTLQTLDVLGGAQEIVRTHLDAALRSFSEAERYVLADLFRQLVTPSGTKIALSAADLAEYVALSEVQITELLETLARPETRIVRAVAPPLGDQGPSRYEIFHDVLATSILDWGSRQTAIRRAEEQRRVARAAVRRRVVRLGAVLAAAAFAVILLLAIDANHQRNQARDQARLAGVEANRARQARALAMEVAAFQVGVLAEGRVHHAARPRQGAG